MSELQVKTFGPFKMPKPFANELRIGNWVSHFYVLATDKIEAPELKKVQVDADLLKHISDNGMLSCYRGIPLTPEIIEKAGFEKVAFNDFQWMYEKQDGNLTPDWTFRIAKYREDIIVEPFGRDNGHISIQYVHQLQNLFFVLTGTELNIEEEAPERPFRDNKSDLV